MTFSLHVDADITRQLQPPENRVLSSISHGQQFKAGDSIRYTGYETIDLCPSGGRSCSPQDWWTTETKNCYVTLGLSRSAGFPDYTFGSSFQGSLKRSGSMNNILTCSFDKNFSFPTNYTVGPTVAVVYVSYGTESFQDWFNLGPWGEHIFVTTNNLPPTASFWQSFSNYNKDYIEDRTMTKINFEGRGTDPEGNVASWELFVNGTRVLSSVVSPPKSPIRSSPVYTLNTDDYPAGPITVKFSVRDVLGLEASVSETVVLGDKTKYRQFSICPASFTFGIRVGDKFPLESRYWDDAIQYRTFCDTPGYTVVTQSSSWLSHDPDKATVTNSGTRGVITGISPGKANFGASYQGLQSVATVNIYDVPPPAPTLIFTADSDLIPYNKATTLRWTSTNATSCIASGAWSGTKSLTTTSESTGNLTSTRTYTLTCSGAGGSISRSVTVTVGSQPALTLKERVCSGSPIPTSLKIKTSRTIVVCDGTTPVEPGSWNITPNQTAFYISGSDTDTSREFTARGNDGEAIKIRATGTGYTPSEEVTLIVDKPIFKPPTPTTEREQWKEVAP